MLSDDSKFLKERLCENEEEGELKNACCPSCLSCSLSGMFCWFFCIPCIWCKNINEGEEMIVLEYGKYLGRIRGGGIHLVNPILNTRKVSVKQNSLDIPTSKVVDVVGNPIDVSGVVTYKIMNSKKAVLDVENVTQFINNQALAVLKTVCSQYPYESNNDQAEDISLRGETTQVRQEMKNTLQLRLNPAGVYVISFDLTDLSYSPEIAQAMLVKQQAQAMITARKQIVTGAVQIAGDSIRMLKEQGVELETQEVGRLASNLVVSICGETKITPTMNV